jgi:cell wall-associated NlpC family hydrolase
MSPSGFDCSGLVAYAYAQVGVSLPHHAASMFGYGVPVSYDQLQPGDLVFANGLGHMGMYIGSGQYVHAPHTGDVVRIASMSSRGDWVGFRRVG